MRAALPDLVDAPAADAAVDQRPRRAARGHDFEPPVGQDVAEFDGRRLVRVTDADQRRPAPGQRHTGRGLRLRIGFPETAPRPHDLAGGLHLGAENGIRLRELDEWEDRFLDRVVRRPGVEFDALLPKRDARHGLGGDLCKRLTGRLGDERDGA